jgi:hypothetical protein
MASIGRYIALAIGCTCLSAACGSDGGDDDACELGAVQGCVPEHNGPRETRYCQADETWSDCTPEALCDPLAQTGCADGLVCYLAATYTTVCAPAETLPCSPVEAMASGVEGPGCQPLCVSDRGNLNEDPEHCAHGEVCLNASLPYENVGVCYTPPPDGE